MQQTRICNNIYIVLPVTYFSIFIYGTKNICNKYTEKEPFAKVFIILLVFMLISLNMQKVKTALKTTIGLQYSDIVVLI